MPEEAGGFILSHYHCFYDCHYHTAARGKIIQKEQLLALSDIIETLKSIKRQILEHVEEWMKYVAPNLSQIVGSRMAAKLMGIAGGLTHLSKMSNSHIQMLGAEKSSSATSLAHTGLVFNSELVQAMPVELKTKAANIVASKCVLAVREHSKYMH